MTQSSGGKWKTKKVTATKESRNDLMAWGQTPLKQSKDIPEYYKDLAMRMGINPIDLANQQLKYITGEEVKQEEKKEEKHSKEVQDLIYKFPTRSRITRARILDELKEQEQNVKTSIFNKKALIRQDQ